MRKPQGLTQPQIAAYFRAANAAARALGEPLDAYRKRVMKEVCNVTSIKQLNRTSDFDAVMTRFAEDADDYQSACHFAVGSGRRLAVLIGAVCEQVMQLKSLETAETGAIASATPAEDYLRSILNRSGNLRNDTAGGWWLDLTDTNLQAVFAMLDTHRRRLIRRINQSTSSSVPLSFSMDIGYFLMGTHLATYELPSPITRTVRVNVQ
ncbi:MAG: hypothetical protein IJ146_10990 [Kiritimatiellae bacterium]|nr:hypothetical protein [Kiritimatiellia bacterium]